MLLCNVFNYNQQIKEIESGSTSSPAKKPKLGEEVEISAIKIAEIFNAVAGSNVPVVAFILAIDTENMGYPICDYTDTCNQKVCIFTKMTKCLV